MAEVRRDDESIARAYLAMVGRTVRQLEADVSLRRRYYAGAQVTLDSLPPDIQDGLAQEAIDLIGEGRWGLNLLPSLVDGVVAELPIAGWRRLDGGDDEEGGAAAAFGAAWQRAAADLRHAEALKHCCVDREGFLALDFDDDGRVGAYVNLLYDEKTGVEVVSETDDGRLTGAIKHYERRVWLVHDQEVSPMEARFAENPAWPVVSYDVPCRVSYEPGRIRKWEKWSRRHDGHEADRQWRVVYDSDAEGGLPTKRLPIVRLVSPCGGELRPEILTLQCLINDLELAIHAGGRLSGFGFLAFIDLAAVANLGGEEEGVDPFAPAAATPKIPMGVGSWGWLRSEKEDQGTVQRVNGPPLGDLREQLHHAIEMLLYLGGRSVGSRPWQQGEPPSGRALKIANRDRDTKVGQYRRMVEEAYQELAEVWRVLDGEAAPVPLRPIIPEPEYDSGIEDVQILQLELDAGIDPEDAFAGYGRLTPEARQRAVDNWQAQRAMELASVTRMASAAMGEGL